MAQQSLSIVSGFEADIRNGGNKLPSSLTGAQGFVSTKSFVSLQMTCWSLKRLRDTLNDFHYASLNPLSIMTLSIEHFHSTTHMKHNLMTQLQYSREFTRSIKESLKRTSPWSAFYYTNRKGSWYPPAENSTPFQTMSNFLPKRPDPIQQSKEDQEKLQTWANSYTRAVRQRTVRQETTMAKMGTLPHYLYSNSISKVVDGAPSLQRAGNTCDHENNSEKLCYEEQDQFEASSSDESSNDDDGEEIISVSKDSSVSSTSLFALGRSSRFGRTIKIREKFVVHN